MEDEIGKLLIQCIMHTCMRHRTPTQPTAYNWIIRSIDFVIHVKFCVQLKGFKFHEKSENSNVAMMYEKKRMCINKEKQIE